MEIFWANGTINLEDTELESSDEEIEVKFIKSVPAKEEEQKWDDKKPINFGLDRRSKIKIEEKSNLLIRDVSEIVEPKNFKEAWNNDDPEERIKWQEAI